MQRILAGRSALCMAGVILLAIGACEKRTTEESDVSDAAPPSRSAQPPETAEAAETERAVDAETLPYADVGEKLVYGYFAFPSDMAEPLPAILLVHDWWGLDDDMRTAANRLAAAGYMVLAIDLYGGATTNNLDKAREITIGVVANAADVDENIRQAIEFVDVAGAPSVGIAGWGFGGGYALNAALRFPDRINAVVVFYGQVPGNTDQLATLASPVLGLFGAADLSVPVDSVQEFAAATSRLGKPAEIEIYDTAGQGFADPKQRQFDAAIAARAWKRMLDFLAENLPSATTS